MAETIRSQATVLEVPVTIQGSKTVEGAEQRELFSETTKTTLVFDNGAVVKLNARVLPGQCVFLRNDQSGREVLCKVLDSKTTGQAGYTDLEFTSYDPNFWDVRAEKAAAGGPKLTAQDKLEAGANSPVAAPTVQSRAPAGEEFSVPAEEPGPDGQKAAAQRIIDEAVRNLVATPNAESGAPARGETPASFLESPAPPKTGSTLVASALPEILMPAHEAPTVVAKSEPSTDETVPASVSESATPAKAAGTLLASASPEVLLPAHDSPIGALKSEPTDEELDWNDAKEAEMLAALATMEAGSKANREPPAKDTPEPKDRARDAASRTVQEKVSQNKPRFANTASKAKLLSMPASQMGKLRGLTAGKNTIAIGIVAFVLLAALLGFAWRMKIGFSSHGANRPAAASAQAKQPTAAASAAQTPSAAVAQSGAAPMAAVGAAPVSKGVKDSTASAAPRVTATGTLSRADQEVLGLALPRKANEKDSGGNVPPRIVSQTPPAIPSWAKELDVGQVVNLDALIDENGNLVEAKPISGPRLLQSAAKRAVELWVFEPALSNGKPVAARMVLTVQFKK
jgi:Gram-negative bacterial TonB protein C-terminal